jgi:hypothetical protein
MQTKLAVINCKGQKQDYPCRSEDMYMKSYVHRTQLAFIKEYYDDYIILSAKYGVILPDDIIEPYSMILHTSNTSKALAKNKNTIMLTREETNNWAKQITTNIIFKKYDHIDFHLPNAYWIPIKKYIDNVCKSYFRVSYPQSLITTGHRYEELLQKLKNNETIDLNMMGKKIISRFPEQNRIYYHKKYPPFKGWARELVKKYPEQRLDEGALVRVDKTSTTGERYKFAGVHHKGWCCDKEKLSKLYLYNGRWRS